LSEPKIRLYVKDNIAKSELIDIDFQQVHYLRNVMRQTAGQQVSIFNGRDGMWRAEIVEISRNSGVLTPVEKLIEQESVQDIWLLFSPVKRTRTDMIIEKATELGVKEIHPILTKYTILKRVSVDKFESTAIEAAEQSRRLSIPKIYDIKSLKDTLSVWDTNRNLYYLDFSDKSVPIAKSLLNEEKGKPCAFIIGPEGGFAPEDRELFESYDFCKPISVGPRILRAETAVISAIACWQSICGDWQENSFK
jgi:16S rRNA (uracil1498-N3)-methyltransferase